MSGKVKCNLCGLECPNPGGMFTNTDQPGEVYLCADCGKAWRTYVLQNLKARLLSWIRFVKR